MTDLTENHVVYYGHRLRFFSFRLWFHPVGGYQTCLIFSADFKIRMFSFVMRFLATRCTFPREFIAIGTNLKLCCVWSSIVVYDDRFSFVTIYKVDKCMMPSVLKTCLATRFSSRALRVSAKKNSTRVINTRDSRMEWIRKALSQIDHLMCTCGLTDLQWPPRACVLNFYLSKACV